MLARFESISRREWYRKYLMIYIKFVEIYNDMKRFFAFVIALISLLSMQYAQTIRYNGSKSYMYTERSDLRRWDNGVYKGLTQREIHANIRPTASPLGPRSYDLWYDGSFYVDEQTKREASLSDVSIIDDAIPSVFYIASDGKLTMFLDNGFPSFRSFPVYPTQELKPGQKWQAKAQRAVDPLYKGKITKMDILVEYTFLGMQSYKGEDVFMIDAQWATRYDAMHRDPKGDSELSKATGNHKAQILVSVKTGAAIVVRDNVDETFYYRNGDTVKLKGTINLFTEYPPSIQRQKIIDALNRVAIIDSSVKVSSDNTTANSNSSKIEQEDTLDFNLLSKNTQDKNAKETRDNATSSQEEKLPINSTENNNLTQKENVTDTANDSTNASEKSHNSKKDLLASVAKNGTNDNLQQNSSTEKTSEEKSKMVVEETPAGLRLSVRDIRFAPDSDQVLKTETKRLDEIAEVLRMCPDSCFLIEGHTASVGKEKGEQILSMQRAKSIVKQFAIRGIPEDSFVCKGYGGTMPIASNATEEGRALNRRVEITILE